MAASQMSEVLQHLRSTVFLEEGPGLTDGQLLGCFIELRDDDAFAALVRRHGPMVWGVCHRLLKQHDAEDAFQATFLVLARKAASVVPRERVSNWLYGVAHQTALQARRNIARRKAREKQVTVMPEPAVVEDNLWRELRPLLDQELSRLPDVYRQAIVLCDLEGKPRKEVARQLGLPEGTVASRLARARALLAKRLARHGLAVSAGSLAAVLAQRAASAGVPNAVVDSTIKAASLLAAGQVAATAAVSVKVTALSEGVMKAMLITKLKAAIALVMILGLVATGATILTARTAAGQDDKGSAAEKSVKRAAKQEKQQDKDKTTVTAWGKEIGGLQAGLGFRPGAHRAYHYDETLTLVVRLRNVGKDTVKFSYLYPFIQHALIVTDSGGKPIPQPKILPDVGMHLPREMELAPGKEIELHELQPLPLSGTGKIAVQYEQVLGPIEGRGRNWRQDPALSKLATGKLELEVKKAKAKASKTEVKKRTNETPAGDARKEVGQGKPAARHDFTNLQRLARALENFNYAGNATTTITVWCQGGGKGTSITIADEKKLDVATACSWGVNGHHNKKGLDLENVAIVSANDRSFRFVNVKKEVAAKRSIGLTVHPGDLVVVLERATAKKR